MNPYQSQSTPLQETVPGGFSAHSESWLPIDIPDDIRSYVQDMIPAPSVRVVRMSLPYTAWSAASATVDVDLFSLPNYCEIVSCWMNVQTAFNNLATTTMSVGPDGSETALLTAQSVKTTGFKKAVGTDFTTNRPIYSSSAKTLIQARCVGSANLSGLNAGQIEFGFAYIDYYNGR